MARSISTNQTGIHPDLQKVLSKHRDAPSQRPIAGHTCIAFAVLLEFLEGWRGEVIIDAGCGVGESTINIAVLYPHAKVIGIDKSIARLDKHKSYVKALNDNQTHDGNSQPQVANYLLLQADLHDFWRLLLQHIENSKPDWHVARQFILYPNPYPKKTQLGKRWHGSALFNVIVKVSANIEIRSNWQLYLQECSVAASFYGLHSALSVIDIGNDSVAYTPFERKYSSAGQACFKLVIRPSG